MPRVYLQKLLIVLRGTLLWVTFLALTHIYDQACVYRKCSELFGQENTEALGMVEYEIWWKAVECEARRRSGIMS